METGDGDAVRQGQQSNERNSPRYFVLRENGRDDPGHNKPMLLTPLRRAVVSSPPPLPPPMLEEEEAAIRRSGGCSFHVSGILIGIGPPVRVSVDLIDRSDREGGRGPGEEGGKDGSSRRRGTDDDVAARPLSSRGCTWSILLLPAIIAFLSLSLFLSLSDSSKSLLLLVGRTKRDFFGSWSGLFHESAALTCGLATLVVALVACWRRLSHALTLSLSLARERTTMMIAPAPFCRFSALATTRDEEGWSRKIGSCGTASS
jgi:hypothetical protein